jgi:uncharacterized membrane protein YdjX (TVP38/TMEM64 family)
MTTTPPSLRGASREGAPPDKRRGNPSYFIIAAILLLACVAASLFLPHNLTATLTQATQKLRALGLAGCLIFIAAEAFAALIGILPGALLGITAGAVYGIAAGFITSAIGILAGAFIAFALSRSYARPLIAGLLSRSRRLTRFDAALTGQSWRMVALLRVSPIMPFSLTSYALGLSGIPGKSYMIGTLASLPALLGYVVIGALGRGTLASGNSIHTLILITGAAATLALTIQLSRLAAQSLKTSS